MYLSLGNLQDFNTIEDTRICLRQFPLKKLHLYPFLQNWEGGSDGMSPLKMELLVSSTSLLESMEADGCSQSKRREGSVIYGLRVFNQDGIYKLKSDW